MNQITQMKEQGKKGALLSRKKSFIVHCGILNYLYLSLERKGSRGKTLKTCEVFPQLLLEYLQLAKQDNMLFAKVLFGLSFKATILHLVWQHVKMSHTYAHQSRHILIRSIDMAYPSCLKTE